jgi:hypothetical protein
VFVRYAPAMDSRGDARSRSFWPAGGSRWLWIIIAAALGVWLVILLVKSDGATVQQQRARAAGFDERAINALSKRRPARTTRPSTPGPMRVDPGQSP